MELCLVALAGGAGALAIAWTSAGFTLAAGADLDFASVMDLPEPWFSAHAAQINATAQSRPGSTRDDVLGVIGRSPYSLLLARRYTGCIDACQLLSCFEDNPRHEVIIQPGRQE
jgi:hypothetical protein